MLKKVGCITIDRNKLTIKLHTKFEELVIFMHLRVFWTKNYINIQIESDFYGVPLYLFTNKEIFNNKLNNIIT